MSTRISNSLNIFIASVKEEQTRAHQLMIKFKSINRNIIRNHQEIFLRLYQEMDISIGWQYQIPAYLKKNDDKIPCAALLHIKNIVALECP